MSGLSSVLLSAVVLLSSGRAFASGVTPSAGSKATAFVAQANEQLAALRRTAQGAAWKEVVEPNAANAAASAHASENYEAALIRFAAQARAFEGAAVDAPTARALKRFRTIEPFAAVPEQGAVLRAAVKEMTDLWLKTSVCSGQGSAKVCKGFNELKKELQSSDPAVARFAWTATHDTTRPLRAAFERYVRAANGAAAAAGFDDYAAAFRSRYDMDDAAVQASLDRLWKQVKPTYEQLHCHARGILARRSAAGVSENGPLPADLFGDMWAQDWSHLRDVLVPHRETPQLDVDALLLKNRLSPEQLTRVAARFFEQLGFAALPREFWERSKLTAAQGGQTDCSSASWDLGGGEQRLRFCGAGSFENVRSLHHELGHIYQYREWVGLEPIYSPRPHDLLFEAAAKAVELSVTPAYLKAQGLLDALPNQKQTLNSLAARALQTFPLFAFGHALDAWRWGVFSGAIGPDEYNGAWWRQRFQSQGIVPPADRDEARLDAATKYHVAADYPYVSYLFEEVLQFQLHRELCRAAGHTGPLHECSIHLNKNAGKKLREMLKPSPSRSLGENLRVLTGSAELDATALVEYFSPVIAWLRKQNGNRDCGWEATQAVAQPAPAPSPSNWPDFDSDRFPDSGDGRNDVAVIVAIESYSAVSSVPGAIRNGNDWYRFLTRARKVPLANVRMLRNADAAKEQIEDALTEAVAKSKPGGTVWFVFIGHGAPSRDGKDGLVVGWDAQQTARSLFARSLPQGEVLSVLAKGKQARTVALIDACFSGQTAAGPLVAGLQPLIAVGEPTKKSKALVLSAGKASEFAGPLPGASRPAFSYLVLGALRGWGDANGDKVVSAAEAVDYARDALQILVTDRAQTPQLWGRDADAVLSSNVDERGPDLGSFVLQR